MEPPTEQPLLSPALALELLRTPPAPIPKSDPLLVGRSCLLRSPPPLLRDPLPVATSGLRSPDLRSECNGAPPPSTGNSRPHGTAEPAAEATAAPAPAAPAEEAKAPAGEAGAKAPAAEAGGGGGRGRGGGGATVGDAAAAAEAGHDGGAAGYRQLPSHAAAELSYDEFVRQYMAPNKPVVIRGATAGWRAAAEWRTPEGALRLDALGRLAGHCPVCVTDTSNQDDGCGAVRTMPLSEYLAWWNRRQQAAATAAAATTAAIAPKPLQPQLPPHPHQLPAVGCDSEATAAADSPAVAAAAERGGSGGGGGGGDSGRGCSAGGGGGLMYLKDWHFVAEFPDYGAYRLPVYFADDWLNAYYDHLKEQAAAAAAAVAGGRPAAEAAAAAARPAAAADAEAEAQGMAREVPSGGPLAAAEGGSGGGGSGGGSGSDPPAAFTSDYRFIYLGPAGTWTPLHSDVLRSHSWSANVCGRKRWLLLDPGHTHLLYDRHALRMAPHLELGRVRSDCDPRDFPGLQEARRHAYEFIQEAGDAVFVPSGWHHCVENLEDTLSINHNWLNGHNAHWTWALLRQQHADAAEAIEDCRQLCPPDEFEGLVQSNLAANTGLSWHGFVDLLACAVRRAMAALRNNSGSSSGTTNSDSEVGQRQSAGGGGCGPSTWGSAAEALAEGCEALLSALLELQRAGGILKEYVAAFEELVIAPAEALGRRRLNYCGAKHAEACRRLQQTPSFLAAQALLVSIEHELQSRGFRVAPVGRLS